MMPSAGCSALTCSHTPSGWRRTRKAPVRPAATPPLPDDWDGVVRLVASMRARTASPSLILHRLGSYAPQHSLHLALAESAGSGERCSCSASSTRPTTGGTSARSRTRASARTRCRASLFFGKEGAVRGRTFQDRVNTISCLAVLHNAVVVWNTLRIGEIVTQLRAEGHVITDEDLARTSPLLHAHINPFGHTASTCIGCGVLNPGFPPYAVAPSSALP